MRAKKAMTFQFPHFVDEQTNNLVLQVDDPFAIRDLIPESRTLNHPDFNITVKWTDANVNLLRQHGYAVPRKEHVWPGVYKPWDHQIELINFMMAHKKCFNLSEPGCVSGDTEYLSPSGWRRIDQYVGGPVAQYWPETQEIEFIEPTEYVKRPCPTMIRFQTARGVDQLLSPEHRVLLADGRVVSAQEVLDNCGPQTIFNRAVKFRTTFRVKNEKALPLTDAQIRLQVAINADGHYDKLRVYVRLKRPRKIDRLRELLLNAGVLFREASCLPVGFTRFSFEPFTVKGFGPK